VHLKANAARILFGLALLTIMIPIVATSGEMTATWNNGFKLADDNGNSVKIGGRLYVDWAWFQSDDTYHESARLIPIDGTEFRTARLFAEGTMHDIVFYKFQVDLSSPSPRFKDAYIGLSKTPIFGMDLLVGQFKQPIGLEELTSSKYITFMERSQTAGYAISRESGIQLSRPFLEDRMTFRGSFFRNSTSRGTSLGNGTYGVASRLTAVPWKGEDSNLLHLGFGFARRNRAIDSEFYVLEPEAHLQPIYKLNEVPADAAYMYDVEAAAVVGPFSVQGEFMYMGNAAPDGLESSAFSSWYGQASWFITGESRPYKASRGIFNRVNPETPYGRTGTGAFEIAARYSSTDLNDGIYQGGTLDAITLGANWYLNPNTRLMLNWVRSDGATPTPGLIDPDEPELGLEQSATGVTKPIQTRFQVDF
jgi:phosphate-selective porin OprO/OprP